MKKLLSLLLLALSIQAITAQSTRVIRGIVTDRYMNEPLIGVSVSIKGTSLGTITDLDGKFELSINDSHKILTINYIGYISQEVPIDSKSEYNIALEEDQMQLDEVVVVAYGTVKKQESSSLAGKIAGLAVSSASIDKKKPATTWKRSGMKDNSIRLQVGENDFLPLEAAQMAVQIDGFRVRVLMDCFFYNNKGGGLEGTFKLKLPTEATPYYFAFGETEYLNEDDDDRKASKEIPYSKYSLEDFDLTYQGIEHHNNREWDSVKEARIVSKQKAAKAYEQTVSGNIDPALMEWGGADMFSCRVYPLSNNKLHRVVIGYDLNMTEALDFREYIMSLPQTEKELKVDVLVHNTPLLQADISPKIVAAGVDGPRTHYSMSNPKEKEFIFRYNSVQPVILVQEEHDEELDIPYFAANYRVELPETLQENLASDAVFMLDVSISSNPDKFNVWLKMINEILNSNRDIIKRFAVLTFNIENRWYARHFQNNNYYNVSRFFDYANSLALEGATDLASALSEASNPSWIKKDKKPKHIFLMSDADCNWGETNMHKFKALINDGDKIHTYKTGTNSSILNYLSKMSGGFAFTVTGEEEAILTAKSFRYRPWNIEKIDVEGVQDFLISGQPTQLYNGQKLIFTGRNIPTGNIYIDVNNGEERKRINYSAVEKINSLLASRVYGQIASSYLENYGYQAEDAAVNYSTYYKVPGQYTSFLMLESESDYDRYGIDNSDAKYFVDDNMVNDIMKKLEESGAALMLGNDKANFKNWLKHLEESDISLNPSDEFENYIDNLSDEHFIVKAPPQTFRLFMDEQQSGEEKDLLSDEDIRFDNLFELAKIRNSRYGKADALKLLSSVVERNASDFRAIYDVAFIAANWGMPKDSYYMMKRLIDMRQEEAVCYLGVADALSTMNNTDLALIYYYICMEADWDGVGDFRYISAMKCRRFIKELKPHLNMKAVTEEFIAYMDEYTNDILKSSKYADSDEADILIITNWNIADTFIDPYVTEPNGEVCYYGNNNTSSGGIVSSDVSRGFGPVIYLLRKAESGKYKIDLDYYNDSGPRTASKSKTYMQIYRDWGRKNEKLNLKTVDLSRFSENYKSDKKEEKNKTVMTFNVK